MLAGARRGYHNAPLVAPDLPDGQHDACLTLLRDTARAFADHRETTHWWPYLTRTAAARLSFLYPEPPVPLDDDATIDLPGSGFDDYLSGLPSKRRSGARRERAEFEAAGPDVRHLTLTDCYAEAGRLLAALQNAHGHPDTVTAMTGLLKRQASAMGDQARVIAVYGNEGMVAFSLCYHHAATTWLRAVGVEHDCPVPFAYFNLSYYLPIEDSYRAGSTALHVGMKAIRAKRLRGARISPLLALWDPAE